MILKPAAGIVTGLLFLLGSARIGSFQDSRNGGGLAKRVPPGAGAATAVLDRACADCHSSQTFWPWYSRIPGIRRLVEADVHRARKELNFSEWQNVNGMAPEDRAGLLNGICEEVTMGVMPPLGYIAMHPQARLGAQDKDSICRWTAGESASLRATLNSKR